jgi:hypothetical protein
MEVVMKEQKILARREFTLAAALLALSGATITISACGSGGSPSGPNDQQPPVNPGDRAGLVGANHGHTAVITAAQLAGSGGISIDIRGQSDHPHTVELSAAEIAAIGASQRVSRESTTVDGHSHTVTFN